MLTRKLGDFQVPTIGLGCMNLSHAYGVPPAPAQAETLLNEALDMGYTLFDTAALYGFGANERLLAKLVRQHRSRITLCSKGGMAGVTFPDGTKRVIDGRPETLRKNCEDSLQRLQTDVMDVYYLHRWDKRIPIEDSIGALADLVQAGKIRALGLSEVSADTLQKAHAVHPISAVQTEYSLWTRNPEIGVLEACKKLGVALVAFSPLGRGFLTAQPPEPDQFVQGDIRLAMPRFSPEHYPHNLALLGLLNRMAETLSCTPAQLALAWLLHQDAGIIPIPGTTQLAHLRENFAASQVVLSSTQLAQLNQGFLPQAIHGGRYNATTQLEIDTEEFRGC